MIEKLISVAENLGWKVSKEDENIYMFQNCSPAGQDICFSIEADSGEVECFVDNLRRYYENYDPSQEAMYWLDESGHGKNGAPYEMCDVYEDMERCRNMIGELYREICYYLSYIDYDSYVEEWKQEYISLKVETETRKLYEQCGEDISFDEYVLKYGYSNGEKYAVFDKWRKGEATVYYDHNRPLSSVFVEFATKLIEEFKKDSNKAVTKTIHYFYDCHKNEVYDRRFAVLQRICDSDEVFADIFNNKIDVRSVVEHLGSTDYRVMKNAVREFLTEAFTVKYAKQILEKEIDNGGTIEADIIDEIRSSSEWLETGYYNDDDVRLAIGRVISQELGLEV